MKASPKKGGHGHITSYTLSIGSAEAREAGFVDANGNPLELEKTIDPVAKTITFKLKEGE